MNTKERILTEAMELFSTNGYDSVSVRTIAAAVGVANSALYKHYKNKQEIFDSIVEECKQRFLNKFLSAKNIIHQDSLAVKNFCLTMYQFQTEDEWIVKFRRILLMEQFHNAQMAELYRKFFVEMPLKAQEGIFQQLMEEGILKNRDPKVLAMEMYSPFFLFHLYTEHNEDRRKLFLKHIDYFFEENCINYKEETK